MSNRHIVISEAVFQRLTCPKPAPKDDVKNDIYYMKMLAEREIQHSQRMGVTEDIFWSTITELEDKVGLNKPHPCVGIKSDFLTCLRDNNYKGLHCTELFQRFSECLNTAANQQLNKTSTTPCSATIP